MPLFPLRGLSNPLGMLLMAYSARHKRMEHLRGQEAEVMSNHAQTRQHLFCRSICEVETPWKVLIHHAYRKDEPVNLFCFYLKRKKMSRSW